MTAPGRPDHGRAIGAALCAAAAVALLVAGVGPWWRIQERGEEAVSLRASFTLLGGEVCRADSGIECRALRYTGRPGLRDELFGWTGRATLVTLVALAALAVVLAFAGGRRRAPLRATIATTAAIAAALAAVVIAVEQLPIGGDTQLAVGLWAAMIGAMLAAAAAAWPTGATGPMPPLHRGALALGVLAVALLAWATIGLRTWWTGTGDFASHGMSPLGIELCDRDQCTQLGLGARRVGILAPLAAVAAVAAAMLVCATGVAVRAARGVAPRGWALATAITGGAAVALAVVALIVVPRRGATIGLGAWGFLAAGLGLIALAVVSHRLLRWIDPADASDAVGPRLVPFGKAPVGPRPVLAALGPAAPPAAAPSPGAPARSPFAPPTAAGTAPSPYAPPAAARSPYAPPIAGAPPTPSPYAPPAPSPYAPPYAAPSPAAAPPPAAARSPYAPPIAGAPIAPRAPTGAASAIPRRVAPVCPTCRLATLWHSKRETWWCSSCKRAM